MVLFESAWFLVLLAVLCIGPLLGLRKMGRAYRGPVGLAALAPGLMLAGAIWMRTLGLRDEVVLTVERYLPAAVELDQLPALPTKAEDPDVMMVMLGVGGPQPLLGFLHAHGPTGFRREEPGGRFAVLFRESLEAGLLAGLKPRPPSVQKLWAKLGGEVREVPVAPGRTLEIGGCSFRVVAVYPEFEVKSDGRGQPVMGTRSAEPKDPWLELECFRPHASPRRVLLSAFRPELTRGLNAPNLPESLQLDYVREGEERQERFVIVTRKDQRITLVEQGNVVRSEALAVNRPFVVQPGLSLTPLGLFDRFYPADSTSGSRAALRLRVEDISSNYTERAWLRPGEGSGMSFMGRFSLRLIASEADPRALRIELRGADAAGVAWPVKTEPLRTDGRTVRIGFHRPPPFALRIGALLCLLAACAWLGVIRFRNPVTPRVS